MKTTKLPPGSDVFIEGVYYDKDAGELEVYPQYHPGWWGFAMTEDEAARALRKLKSHGVFFWRHIRFIVAKGLC